MDLVQRVPEIQWEHTGFLMDISECWGWRSQKPIWNLIFLFGTSVCQSAQSSLIACSESWSRIKNFRCHIEYFSFQAKRSKGADRHDRTISERFGGWKMVVLNHAAKYYEASSPDALILFSSYRASPKMPSVSPATGPTSVSKMASVPPSQRGVRHPFSHAKGGGNLLRQTLIFCVWHGLPDSVFLSLAASTQLIS